MSRIQQQSVSGFAEKGRFKSKELRYLFHHGNDLVACVDGQASQRVLRAGLHALGQLTSGSTDGQARQFMIDRSSSVQGVQCPRDFRPMHYTAYGYAHAFDNANFSGYNGAYLEAATGNYPLGAGNRSFSPAVMRFLSPDQLSPFLKGGINAYAYCQGDPVNRSDPTGNSPVSIFNKSNFPRLHGFLSTPEGRDFRLRVRKFNGHDANPLYFHLRVEEGATWATYLPGKKPVLPMYVSPDGNTSFTVLMLDSRNKAMSVLPYHDEFVGQGFTLSQRRPDMYVLTKPGNGSEMEIKAAFTPVPLKVAEDFISRLLRPRPKKGGLAPSTEAHIRQVRSGMSSRKD